MQDGSTPSWLFLDFDGVICDSLEECYQASWLTDSKTIVGRETPPRAPFPEDYRQKFLSCRPFIRSGEDYILLHRLVAQDRVPRSQAEFDEELTRLGRAALDVIKSELYATRESLLLHHRSLWLSWNPLFPGMSTLLNAVARGPRVRILSTKKAAFIAEILSHQGVTWPLEHILYSGNQRKLDFVEALAGPTSALLLDDQIDHLDFEHPSCRCVLAGWGYVGPEARDRAASCWDLPSALVHLKDWS